MATLRVSGTGNNVSFEEKKSVLIQRQRNGIFVQTDKPVYNPGQRGKRHTYGVRQKAGERVTGSRKQGLCGWWSAHGTMNAEERKG